MHPSDKDVGFAWKLVAQFVSWDFCRYVCQQSNNDEPETDVLTFLRNMFVERTEKLISEVTKHEIIAKFILEVKAIRSLSRFPCVVALSKTVQTICPELKEDVAKLLRHLESLLNIWDSSQECCNPELVELRMVDAVSVFTKEANKLLPPPDLLQIIQPWVHKHSSHRGKHKPLYSKLLFEKAILCLQNESISPMEAKCIAVAVCEDTALQKIVIQAESETETELDSEPFSFISSQVNSQEPMESSYSSPRKSIDKLVSTQPSSNISSGLDELLATDSPLLNSQNQEPKQLPSPININHDNSLHFTQDSEYCASPPPVSEYVEIDMEDVPQFAQSSGTDDDDSDNSSISILHWKTHAIRARVSDDETSDCDTGSFRFLTPTMYKENAQQTCGNQVPVWSASQQSDITVASVSIDNKKEDPTWRQHLKSTCTKRTQITRNYKKKITKISKNTPKAGKNPVTFWSESQQSPIPSDVSSDVENEEEEEDLAWNMRTRSAEKKNKKTKPKEKEKKKLISVPCDMKKRKILFHGLENYFDPIERSKSSRIQQSEEENVVPEVAEEVEVRTRTSPAKKKLHMPEIVHKRKIVPTSTKVKKCRYCSRTYKTQIAMKRHIFLKHPLPVLGDDDDDDDQI